VRVGIGRGEVGEDDGGCRTCMQRLGSIPRVPPASRRLRQLLRRPRPTWEQTGIGQGLEGVKECYELKRKQGERAGFLSTVTSPAAVDLPQRRRASVVAMHRLQGGVLEGVRESGEKQMSGREGSREGVLAYNSGGGFGLGYTVIGCDWSSWAALRGGVVR
jgi:hypothetical protein